MTENKSWENRAAPPAINPARFNMAKESATDIGLLMTRAFSYVNPDHIPELMKKFSTITGNNRTLSSGGLLAAIDELTPEIMTKTEISHFRLIADLISETLNSILGKSLTDKNPILGRSFQKCLEKHS